MRTNSNPERFTPGETAPPPYSFNMGLGGAQGCPGCCGEKKPLLLLPGLDADSNSEYSVDRNGDW
jgi:hypothetical protein